MLCPFDATTLQVVSRSGVEIDWYAERRRDRDDDDGDDRRRTGDDGYRPKKRKSLLSEIFDF